MVNVALLVRLEAKPGKEDDVERDFFEVAYLWFKRSQQPLPGLQPVWDHQRSASLMPSRTSQAGKHICLAVLLLR